MANLEIEMTKPDYIVLIWNDSWSGSPRSVYPVAFKVLGESKNSFQFELPPDDVRTKYNISFLFPRQKEGIRVRREGGKFDRNRPTFYYADKSIVLCHTDSPELPPQAHEFTRLLDVYREKNRVLTDAKNAAEAKFKVEEDEMDKRHDAEAAALKAKKSQAVVTESKAMSDAWAAIWDFKGKL